MATRKGWTELIIIILNIVIIWPVSTVSCKGTKRQFIDLRRDHPWHQIIEK